MSIKDAILRILQRRRRVEGGTEGPEENDLVVDAVGDHEWPWPRHAGLDPLVFRVELTDPGSGVRLTHLPTGRHAASLDKPTQRENRDAALEQLREMLSGSKWAF